MQQSWLKPVLPIATIFSFRMLGLFMLIPIFSTYALSLKHATPTLIGIALGGYGLTQGLLQIPFGFLSDRLGRKIIISIGLLFFAAGSLLGAWTDSIYGMIIARILQGTGAIGSVLMALMADLTTDEHRTKAMAVIGIIIGMSFSLAMVLSPAIASHFGLSGIFYFTTILACIGFLLLHTAIPTPKKEPFDVAPKAKWLLLKSAVKNRHLQRLNLGIFSLHLILTSTFFSIPHILQNQQQLGHINQPWHFYLPLMVCAFLIMLPFIIIAEKKRAIKSVFLSAIAVTGVSQLALVLFQENWFGFCGSILIYFVAFNTLEAVLPSLTSRQAEAASKGTAMGIYSSCQFLGIFVGGALSGIIFQYAGNQGIFIANSLITLLWFCVAITMKPDSYLFTLSIDYPEKTLNEDEITKLAGFLPGVHGIIFSKKEKLIYLKIDKANYLPGSIDKLINQTV